MVMMEDHQLLTGSVVPIELKNAQEYVFDIESIRYAMTGIVNAWDSNRFFEEATQMLLNAVSLFQQGFFDAAFYSMREAIELSIGTIYLISNKDKLNSWKKQEKGFESGKMAAFLRDHEATFSELRKNMAPFFDNVRETEAKINKYVHKQGFITFYSHLYNSEELKKRFYKISSDFEKYISVCIGAVAVYRLALDPLPVVLMDDDLRMRSPDLLTEPYTKDFVDKYIGEEAIEAYKQTEFYQGFRDALAVEPKQNDAVYDLIHYQIFDRKKIKDIESQMGLLSLYDKIAYLIFTTSDKISKLFVYGLLPYVSDVQSKRNAKGLTAGTSYFEQFFSKGGDFNIPYEGVFLSRCKIRGDYTYFEHNEKLSEDEINAITYEASCLTKEFEKTEALLLDIMNSRGKCS